MKALSGINKNTLKLARRAGIDLTTGVPLLNGRVRVRVGKAFPYAPKDGRAYRARVVWWLHTGDAAKGWDIHHKDENRGNDRFGNLQKLRRSDHSKLHSSTGITFSNRVCLTCGNHFKIPKRKLCEKTRGRYCTHLCFLKRKVSKQTRKKIRIAGLGRRHSRATRQKMSRVHIKRWRQRKKLMGA